MNKIMLVLILISVLTISLLGYIDWKQTKLNTQEDIKENFITKFMTNERLVDFIQDTFKLQDVAPVRKVSSKELLTVNIQQYKKFVNSYTKIEDIQNKEIGNFKYDPDVSIEQNIIIKPTIYDYIKGDKNKDIWSNTDIPEEAKDNKNVEN